MGFARRNLTTILVAMVTAALTAGGPAIAATIADYARDANKVDGKHAVSANATTEVRKGKLVATNKAGHLPNNIIAKAPNANRLDGLDSKAFVRTGATGVNVMAIRGDASVRHQSDPAATVTRLSAGVYCITAPGALEGAVGVLQNAGGGKEGTIRVSMGIGSACNASPGSNITVETFTGVTATDERFAVMYPVILD